MVVLQIIYLNEKKTNFILIINLKYFKSFTEDSNLNLGYTVFYYFLSVLILLAYSLIMGTIILLLLLKWAGI